MRCLKNNVGAVVEKNNGAYTVSGGEKCTETYEGDLIVHGAGRSAALIG